jgi:ACS family tartrate transporter-like MFS transporter
MGLAASALARGLGPSIALLSISLAGFYAFKAPFGVIPRLYLPRASAVIAFAVVNAMGNAGSFVGPYLFGLIRGRTHSLQLGLLTLAAVTFVAAALTVLARFGEPSRRRRSTPARSKFQHGHIQDANVR